MVPIRQDRAAIAVYQAALDALAGARVTMWAVNWGIVLLWTVLFVVVFLGAAGWL